jgi:diguanylate cyclase
MSRVSGQVTLSQIISRVHARVISFALALVSVFLIGTGFVIIRGYAARDIELIADSVGYAIEPAVVFHDGPAIRSGMMAAATVTDLDAIEVRDLNGTVLARWNRPDVSYLERVSRSAGNLLWPVPIMRTVKHDGVIIAFVYVYGGVGELGRYLLLGALISIASIGVAFLATSLLARRLQNHIVSPLTRLANVIHAVRDQQAFDRRVPRLEIQEIDDLAEDLNVLLAELEGWHAGLTIENRKLTHQALHDGLTELGNRQMFLRTLESTIDYAMVNSEEFAMLYLDANNFKRINDEHGHSTGDIILKEISKRLRSSIRSSDIAFRLGGDEFVILLAPPVDHIVAAHVNDRIEATMKIPVVLPAKSTLQISVSTGIALFPADGTTSKELIEKADELMYRNKRDRQSAK